MSYNLQLEIDLSSLVNHQKGRFLSSVQQLLPANEFQSFRNALSKRTSVYNAKYYEYMNLINLSKIIKLVEDNSIHFSLYKQTQNKRMTISQEHLEMIIAEFKTVHSLPTFLYHPHVYESGIISYYEDKCEVCNEGSYFFQEGSYGENELESICIHCIASGRATSEHDVFFHDYYPTSFHDEKKLQELHFRTPSILSWQEIGWVEHCYDFCAYIGKVNWDDICHLETELLDILADEASRYQLNLEEFKNALNRYIDGHLFTCLHCNKPHLITETQ